MAGDEASVYLQATLQVVWAPIGQTPVVRVDPDRPILLLWDRAPWHRGPAIRQFLAEHPALEIFFFPPGSPDLNPQEHVWKDARRHVSHNHTVKKLDRLADQFEQHLTHTSFPK